MANFWTGLKKPFTALAPMEDVTDTVFRQVVAKYGKPDVLYTEFVSVDGLSSEGLQKLLPRLKFSKIEHPVVAQIWGTDPEKFYLATRMISKMNFDGIDINMGCPDKGVLKKGAGGALINTPELAGKIIDAAKKGAGELPVSIKTRIGVNQINTEKWIGFLLSLDLPAITIHARTVKEMSKVPAHWDEIKKAVELRNKLNKKTLIIGNGDVVNFTQALDLAQSTGVDGIMIGRGILNNLWVFNRNINPGSVTPKMKISALIYHITLFEKTWATSKNYDILKKFYKAYISGFTGAKELRIKLMQIGSAGQAIKLLQNFSFSL